MLSVYRFAVSFRNRMRRGLLVNDQADNYGGDDNIIAVRCLLYIVAPLILAGILFVMISNA